MLPTYTTSMKLILWIILYDQQILNQSSEGTVPTLGQMENMVNISSEDIPKLAIDHTTYVFGLADVTGEVMRFVTNKSEPESAKKSLDFLREMYDIFVSIQEKEMAHK